MLAWLPFGCQFHYRALLGAQYRWDNTIDAPYRFAMPVRPEIGRASTPCGRGRTLENASSACGRQDRPGAGRPAPPVAGGPVLLRRKEHPPRRYALPLPKGELDTLPSCARWTVRPAGVCFRSSINLKPSPWNRTWVS